jgi:NAD(P)H-flavin reductase
LLAPGVRRLLLIGEGVALAPLVWLADEESARGRSVTILLTAASGVLPYPLDLLHREVEVVVAHSSSGQGSLSSLLPELAGWADQIVVSSVAPLYRQIDEIVRPLPFRRPCAVLMAPPMPCGVGLCGACAVTLHRHGARLACVDGPAFQLRDLV